MYPRPTTMGTSPAAGIIPYYIDNNTIYLLLGKELSNNKWCGFVGGSEESDTDIVETAIREFNEETCGIFSNYTNIFRTQLHTTEPIKSKTSKREVYLWFIEFPENFRHIGYQHAFMIQRSISKDDRCREKTEIKWIAAKEIINGNSNNITQKFKGNLKTFLNNFDKCFFC